MYASWYGCGAQYEPGDAVRYNGRQQDARHRGCFSNTASAACCPIDTLPRIQMTRRSAASSLALYRMIESSVFSDPTEFLVKTTHFFAMAEIRLSCRIFRRAILRGIARARTHPCLIARLIGFGTQEFGRS